MGNSKVSDECREYANVDSAPEGGSGGFFTKEVSMELLERTKKIFKIFFSIREASAGTSAVTVVLQFKCEGDVHWQDYVSPDGSVLAIGNRLVLEEQGSKVYWRAGVKEAGYVSGAVIFGFDW